MSKCSWDRREWQGLDFIPGSVASVNAQDIQQDYTDFQNCLTGVEVDGVVTEQQILDCLDSTYGDTASEGNGSGDDTGDDSDGNGESSQDDSNEANSE